MFKTELLNILETNENHIIEYTVKENFVAIRRQSIYYLNKANNYYDRYIWKNTSDSHLIYFDTLSCLTQGKKTIPTYYVSFRY